MTTAATISSTHFWLKAASVPLTLESISTLDDTAARYFLADMRWSKDQQTCPDCGVIDRHYDIRTRKQWRCKHCFRTFSVTTGTPFADRKIGYRKLLLAIFAFIINQKGLAALALRRIIGGQYRTAFTLLHKLREAVMITVSQEKLSGVVEIDGGHFSGKKRKGRKKKPKLKPEDKTEVPAKYSQQRDKIPAFALPVPPEPPHRHDLAADRRRHVGPGESAQWKPIGLGACRTLVAVCRSENSADIEALAKQHIEGQSLIRTDELPGYGNLKLMGYEHQVVNHSIEFSTDDGVNENQAESFFSRMRRACIGIYHRVTPRYMLDYATEMAWREDVRRRNTADQLQNLVATVFSAGISADWINYCRGNKRKTELLFVAPVPASA
jgi:transposase-like protein